MSTRVAAVVSDAAMGRLYLIVICGQFVGPISLFRFYLPNFGEIKMGHHGRERKIFVQASDFDMESPDFISDLKSE